MITLPDTRLDLDDYERVTDWAELSLLASDRDTLSTSDIADVIHDSLMVDDDEAGTQQQAASERADAVTRSVRQRRRHLGEAYPFIAKNDVVTKRSEWSDNLCFTMLLVADVGRFYRTVKTSFDPASPFARLFEKVVRAALQKVFKGTAVRFGVPREEGWPTGIVDRLEVLASEFGLVVDSPKAKTGPKDGDIGLDVAVRFKFGDEGAGSGIVLTQCATGQNWKGKGGAPSLRTWSRLVDWRSPLIKAMAFPWRRDIDDREFGRLAVSFDAIFFDRLRLLSAGNPDHNLSPLEVERIRSWCSARLGELPTVQAASA